MLLIATDAMQNLNQVSFTTLKTWQMACAALR